MPVLSLDSHFMCDLMETEHCPCLVFDGYTWKNWESKDTINWTACADDIMARKDEGHPVILVESFHLCSDPKTFGLIDVVVVLDLTKEVCFSRRHARALDMALHLEPGTGDDMNYEILSTYAAPADHASVLAKASKVCAQEREYAWLRLYFEEVIWPEAERQREDLARITAAGKPTLELDVCEPAGKDEWLAQWIPMTVEWLLQQMPDVAFVQGG